MEEVKSCEQVRVLYACPHCGQEMARPIPVEKGKWSCFGCGGLFTIPDHFPPPAIEIDRGIHEVNFGSLKGVMGNRTPQQA